MPLDFKYFLYLYSIKQFLSGNICERSGMINLRQ